MYKLLLICGFFFCGSLVEAQSLNVRLKGKISNFYGSYMTWQLPNAGVNIGGNPLEIEVNEGAFDVEVPMVSPGFISVYMYTCTCMIRVWAVPGSEMELYFDWNEPRSSLKFAGDQKLLNRYLNRLKRTDEPSKEKWVKDLFGEVSLPRHIDPIIEEEREKEVKALEALKKKTLVSSTFELVMQLERKYFWDRIKSDVYQQSFLDPAKAFANNGPTNWQEVTGVKTHYYFQFLIEAAFSLFPDESHIPRLKKASEHLSGKVREAFWAHYIYFIAEYGHEDPEVVEAYKLFEKQFPNSAFKKFVYRPVQPMEDAYALAQLPITKAMEIDTLNEYKDIESIVAKYKGQVLYFDVWATWCGPCIYEFNVRFKEPLKAFIKDKPIKVIYLSVDQDKVDQKWKDFIVKFRLNSFNDRLGTRGLYQVMEYLGHNTMMPFGIPRYFIVDKEGKLVNTNAPSPSDGQVLFDELKKYLQP